MYRLRVFPNHKGQRENDDEESGNRQGQQDSFLIAIHTFPPEQKKNFRTIQNLLPILTQIFVTSGKPQKHQRCPLPALRLSLENLLAEQSISEPTLDPPG